MYPCESCGKQFVTTHALRGHLSSHNRGENYLIGRKKKQLKIGLGNKCPHCGVVFENYHRLGGHITKCVKNPNALVGWKEKLVATGRRHSEESKKLISERRITYLTANPDKVPYKLNHSSKESYPERVFREALVGAGIEGWVQEYQNGMYSYDFGFPNEKIDVEIDGSTHSLESVQKIDQKRDNWSINQGWKVVRFSAVEIKRDLSGCIRQLQQILRSLT